MIDAHTHLDLCDGPAADLVAEAGRVGVDRLVTVGTDGASCRAALAAAEELSPVRAAIGRHPNAASGWDEAGLAELRTLVAHPECVAVGETGLDFYREGAPRADQERAFRDHIDLAREVGKPLVIHTRAAEEPTLDLLEARAGGVRVILHCFSMPGHLDRCLDHEDWWFSFAGNVTYPSAGDLRSAAARVPAERLLVETDAPYLSPQPVRKERNQPARVVLTAQALAEVRDVPEERLAAALEASAAEAFGW